MIPEKQHLIEDLLADEAADYRSATLHAGGGILRRRRRWRMARIGITVAVVVIASAFGVSRLDLWKPVVSPYSSAGHNPAPRENLIRSLSDDELLALFPETPVGLATLSDGRKRLIFPRPGDESRFITRL